MADHLNRLRDAKDLEGFAKLLGYKPSTLAYIVYVMSDEDKYSVFSIPKKNGEERIISKPSPKLMQLQRRLSKYLLECIVQIEAIHPNRKSLSHGFHKDRSISTNASIHTNRKYVFNVDIEDYFGSINFGRVRGFFLKDQNFLLSEKIATLIAQITCFKNKLPQGSPTSPIISNLIGHILDVRLSRLAKRYKCTYSRYADDITFSTNKKQFPEEVGYFVGEGHVKWTAGKQLHDVINRSGFSINQNKTRMSFRNSRQSVTGIVVNKKINVPQEYCRTVRSMCHMLFSKGHYFYEYKDGEPNLIENLNPLHGRLTYIDSIKMKRHIHGELRAKLTFPKDYKALDLFRRFLFYKNFISLGRPLIVTEGWTDISYLKCAAKNLKDTNDLLYKNNSFQVDFLRHSQQKREVLDIADGYSSFPHFMTTYSDMMRRFKHKPNKHPVILLIDNDDAVNKCKGTINSKANNKCDISTTDDFYYLGENLYLIKTLENGTNFTKIEDCFDQSTLDIKINGKSFDPDRKHGDMTCYGKGDFAKKIVEKNFSKLDMSGFQPLISRIGAVIEHYTQP